MNAFTFEEFLAREAKAGRLDLPLKKIADRALLHGHCHQKAFDVMGPVQKVLKTVPGLDTTSSAKNLIRACGWPRGGTASARSSCRGRTSGTSSRS